MSQPCIDRLASVLPAAGVPAAALLVAALLSGCAHVPGFGGGNNDQPDGVEPITKPVTLPETETASAADASNDVAQLLDSQPGVPKPRRAPAALRRDFADATDLLQAGDLAAAEALLTSVVAAWPDYAAPWTNLGLLLSRQGPERQPEAMAALDKAIALAPTACPALIQRALLHRDAGDIAAAWADNNQCLGAWPRQPVALRNQAVLAEIHLGQPEQAAKLYSRYLAVSGDQRVAPWLELLAVEPPLASVASSGEAQP